MTNELQAKISSAISILQNNICEKGFVVLISGGRDSCVLKHLVQAINVKAKFYYIRTTFESKTMMDYLNVYHSDVEQINPEINIYDLIRKHGVMPTPMNTFCCRAIKKKPFFFHDGSWIVGGKRQAEGKRVNVIVEPVATRTDGHIELNPIYDWSTENVLEYIEIHNLPLVDSYRTCGRSYNCTICPTFTEGTKRENLTLFPDVGDKVKEICYEIYNKNDTLKASFSNQEDYWNWWLSLSLKNPCGNNPG